MARYWVVAIFCPMVASAQSFESARPARNIAFLLESQSLDAYAVADPQEPGRFVAALHFPRGQLLVVSGVHSSPRAIAHLISDGDHREAYFALQFRSLPGDRFFVQDERADGLLHSPGDSRFVDVVYERGTSTPLRFDGDPQGQQLTDAEYAARCARADDQYADALRLLKTAIEKDTRSDSWFRE